MIDHFTIFNRGGAVLWKTEITPIGLPSPVDSLVQNVFLEEKQGQNSYNVDNYTVKWTFENDLDLVFVAVYVNLSQLPYVDELLDKLKNEFVSTFRTQIPHVLSYYNFDPIYQATLDKFEAKALSNAPKAQKDFKSTSKSKKLEYNTKRNLTKNEKKRLKKLKAKDGADSKSPTKSKPKSPSTEEKSTDDGEGSETEGAEDVVISDEPESEPDTTKISEDTKETNGKTETEAETTESGKEGDEKLFETNLLPETEEQETQELLPQVKTSSKADKKLAELKMMRGGRGGRGRGGRGAGRGGLSSGPKKPAPPPPQPAQTPTVGKKPRVWDGGKLTEAEARALDRSGTAGQTAAMPTMEEMKAKYGEVPKVGDGYIDDEGEDESEVDDKKVDGKLSESGKFEGKAEKQGIFSYLKVITGGTLTKEDLMPVLQKFHEQLMKKNVANEISEKLCESVLVSLDGKKTGSFTTVQSIVKQSLETALTKILTPKKSFDLLEGIAKAKDQKRPYTIVFVGVNGVGKSTSLSKVAAYLLSKQLKVSIAACDTFRSGAIEQLRTHAHCLNIPLYDRGYNKDAASVAFESIRTAKKDGMDVVLIDTAGRMQDNDPLMRALSKLINTNKPDLVLFVGEALVGNDGVDQLTKFNRCLVDLSDRPHPHLIDGVFLTKFDTIDDKCGAAISMTYSTGIPIMFVGVGQTYRDLRKLSVKALVKALLK